MADVPLSSILPSSVAPKRQVVTLTASNASLAIPSWAQGGKGVVYVTGCGAGASGGVSVGSGTRGDGGGSGAVAEDLPIVIPSGVSTLNAQIGAGGAAVSSTIAASGNAGGATTLTVGAAIRLVLQGGGVSSSAYNAFPYIGSDTKTWLSIAANGTDLNTIPGYGVGNGTNQRVKGSGSGRLFPGQRASGGSLSAHGFGEGASSPFGAGGPGLAAGPTTNSNGVNATGYGAGGSGALVASGTSALLHMNGANGGTTFTDDVGNTWTSSGATTSTAQSKFGTASLLFNAATDVVTTPTSTIFDLPGDFCIEFFFYKTANPGGTSTLVTRNFGTSPGWEIYLNTDGTVRFYSGTDIVSTGVFTNNAWHHVCFQRSSGTIRAFGNGVLANSASHATNHTLSASLGFGRSGLSAVGVYIDEFRFTKGDPVYSTSGFTPPAAELVYSPTTATSGAGAPGLLILEFVEGT